MEQKHKIEENRLTVQNKKDDGKLLTKSIFLLEGELRESGLWVMV